MPFLKTRWGLTSVRTQQDTQTNLVEPTQNASTLNVHVLSNKKNEEARSKTANMSILPVLFMAPIAGTFNSLS